MAGLLPSTLDISAADESSSRVIGLEDNEASDLPSAPSSGTARRMLAALHEEPTNTVELVERVDTLLQNVQYRPRKLDDAGLVEVADTVYSEKGREMKVYAPADRPLVVIAAGEETQTELASMLSGLLGGVAVLALLSALVQWVTTRGVGVLGGDGSAAESADAGAVSTIAAEAASAAAQVVPPGLIFSAGSLTILLVVAVVQLIRR